MRLQNWRRFEPPGVPRSGFPLAGSAGSGAPASNHEREPMSEPLTETETTMRGYVSGMSFAFGVGEDEWVVDNQKSVTRIVPADGVSDLFDCSCVTFPAYPQTDAAMRAKKNARGSSNALTRLGGIRLEERSRR